MAARKKIDWRHGFVDADEERVNEDPSYEDVTFHVQGKLVLDPNTSRLRYLSGEVEHVRVDRDRFAYMDLQGVVERNTGIDSVKLMFQYMRLGKDCGQVMIEIKDDWTLLEALQSNDIDLNIYVSWIEPYTWEPKATEKSKSDGDDSQMDVQARLMKELVPLVEMRVMMGWCHTQGNTVRCIVCHKLGHNKEICKSSSVPGAVASSSMHSEAKNQRNMSTGISSTPIQSRQYRPSRHKSRYSYARTSVLTASSSSINEVAR
ncbi:hypothetical protein ACLOJK_020198 [Asimina triloba]